MKNVSHACTRYCAHVSNAKLWITFKYDCSSLDTRSVPEGSQGDCPGWNEPPAKPPPSGNALTQEKDS
eukprot:4337713-Prorocentrum_lima.AAC.1